MTDAPALARAGLPEVAPSSPRSSPAPAPDGPPRRGWKSGMRKVPCAPPRDPGDATKPPSYVQACEEGRWSLRLRSKSDPRARLALPYRCHSWRHAGECRTWRAHENYRRLVGGLDRFRVEHVLFLVLTFDRAELEHEGVTRWDTFRSLWRHWQSLRQALLREARRTDVTAKLHYALTVEVHRSGWPHVNVILVSPYWANRLRVHDYCTRLPPTAEHPEHSQSDVCEHPDCPRNWIAAHAEGCGFGKVLTIEHARSAKACASYVTKLAGEIELQHSGAARVGGELLKLSQVPENAPPRFRRLRSSRRFLDPPFRNPDWTGALVFGRVEIVKLALTLGIDLGLNMGAELGRARAAGEHYHPPPWVTDRVTLRLLELEAGRIYGRPAAAWTRRYADGLSRELLERVPGDEG